MIADIYARKVNCVIVKDLSRLSRNYYEAGELIESMFVKMNVRFISLAEGIDSYKSPDSVSSILVPIANVMNDQYCYQTSKKIRQVFDYKKRNGEFIGSYASYGYAGDITGIVLILSREGKTARREAGTADAERRLKRKPAPAGFPAGAWGRGHQQAVPVYTVTLLAVHSVKLYSFSD